MRRSLVVAVLAAGGAGCGDGCDPAEVVPDARPVDPPPDADEGECGWGWVSAEYHYTVTWPDTAPVGVAIDSAGGIVYAGTFWATVDLDPGPGTLVASTTSRRELVIRLDPTGATSWVRVFDERQQLTGLALGTDDTIVLTGVLDTGFVTTFDFDPGPGVAEHPVVPTSKGPFVVALDLGGAFRWARTAAAPSAYHDSPTVVAVRPDGVILVGGARATRQLDFGQDGEILFGPDGGFVWVLSPNGRNVAVIPVAMPGVVDLSVDADGGAVVLGANWLEWDGDYTYGVDVQYAPNSVFVDRPAPTVTRIEPDLSYGWSRTRVFWAPIWTVRLDAAGRVYLAGTTGHPCCPDQLLAGADLDPGPDERWVGIGFEHVGRWDRDGTYGWTLATTAYVVATDGETAYWVSRESTGPLEIWSAPPSGRYHWRLLIPALGRESPRALTARSGRIAMAGQFQDSIDHAFGTAPPDPRTAVGESADAYLTVFSDGGGEQPRCAETLPGDLKSTLCIPGDDFRSCAEIHAECGDPIDPCNGEIMTCDACFADETCGGGGRAHGCGRPAPTVIADGLAHPRGVAVDATHVYVATHGDFGPLVVVDDLTGDRLPGPVIEAGGVWRVPRDGGAPPELLSTGPWRVSQLLVGEVAVYVRIVPDPNELDPTPRHLRMPKEAPTAATTLPDPMTLLAVIGDELYYLDEGTAWRRPGDGSDAPRRVYAPPSPELKFHGGRIYYPCVHHSNPAAYGICSIPQHGLAALEVVHTPEITEGIDLGAVSDLGITYAVWRFTGPGATETDWYRVPLGATPQTPPVALGALDWPFYPHYAQPLGIIGDEYWYLKYGLQSADTRDGELLAIAFGGAMSRPARWLNHPRAIAIDGDTIFLVEEGNLGMFAKTGRVLRIDR